MVIRHRGVPVVVDLIGFELLTCSMPAGMGCGTASGGLRWLRSGCLYGPVLSPTVEPSDPPGQRPWVPPVRAIMDSTAAADGLVPLGDDRLDEMLAGGLRVGELCVYYATAEVGVGGVRRRLPDIVCHCATTTGAVFYVPLVEVATGAVGEAQRRLEKAKAFPVRVLAPPRQRSVEDIAEQADYYAERDDFRLMVIDPFDAILADPVSAEADPDADPEEEGEEPQAAQVSRELKGLARSLNLPVVLACATWTGRRRGPYRSSAGRDLPADPLVAAADVMIRTNGRYPEIRKNRHGPIELPW